MSKKIVLFLFMALALAISACQRSASAAPQATPTLEANFPQPVATSGMNAIEIAGTQTAIATAGLPLPLSVSGTNVVATFTPLAGINQNTIIVQATDTLQPGSVAATSTPLPSPTTNSVVVPTNTPIPYTAAPVVNPGTYTLHEGEFPYCLARRFNVNPDDLLSMNGLSSNQSYYAPGTTLKIPSSGSFPGPRALKSHPATYTVVTGDTIYSIACEFGDVDPMAIVNANGLSGSYALTTGSQIQVP